MKRTLLSALIISGLALAGCLSTKKTVILPSQTDVDRAQTTFPGYTLVELNEGKTLYEQHCDNCHALPAPPSHNETEWRSIVPSMVTKVNKKMPNALDARAQDLILKYAVTMSNPPKAPVSN